MSDTKTIGIVGSVTVFEGIELKKLRALDAASWALLEKIQFRVLKEFTIYNNVCAVGEIIRWDGGTDELDLYKGEFRLCHGYRAFQTLKIGEDVALEYCAELEEKVK